MQDIELVPDYPANIARLLQEDRIDIGLVPVAIIPGLPTAQIVTDFCIGCEGPVASVALLSQVPLQEIKTILVDYQSRSSARLLRILVKHYWKLNLVFEETSTDYRHRIEGTTAGLVIGDRCLEYLDKVNYSFDLGEAWIALTGLPFVFAAWVSNKPLPAEFLSAFNAANQVGVEAIPAVAQANPIAWYDSLTYFSRNISYTLTPRKKQGLALFLNYLAQSNDAPI